jgi:hypothetical protein
MNGTNQTLSVVDCPEDVPVVIPPPVEPPVDNGTVIEPPIDNGTSGNVTLPEGNTTG